MGIQDQEQPGKLPGGQEKDLEVQIEVIKPKTGQGQSLRSGVAESATRWSGMNLEVYVGINGGYQPKMGQENVCRAEEVY